jgi:hypothetical protein
MNDLEHLAYMRGCVVSLCAVSCILIMLLAMIGGL